MDMTPMERLAQADCLPRTPKDAEHLIAIRRIQRQYDLLSSINLPMTGNTRMIATMESIDSKIQQVMRSQTLTLHNLAMASMEQQEELKLQTLESQRLQQAKQKQETIELYQQKRHQELREWEVALSRREARVQEQEEEEQADEETVGLIHRMQTAARSSRPRTTPPS